MKFFFKKIDFSTMTSGNSSDLSNSKLLSKDDRQLRRSDTLTYVLK